MKKILFSLAVIAAALITTSCEKSDTSQNVVEPTTQGTPITLSVSTGAAQTRSFLDDIGATQTWEKTMNTMTVFVYNSERTFVLQKVYSGETIAKNEMTLILPDARPGESYTIYAVANAQVSSYESEQELLERPMSSVAPHGTFDEITSPAIGNNRFIMSGYSKLTIAPLNEQNRLTIDLTRLAIKAAMETTLELSETHTGAAKIVNVSYEQNRSTYLFDSPHNTDPYLNMGTFTQIPHTDTDTGNYQNLFYLTEETQGWPITLSILYDRDGDFLTTDDQIESSASLTIPSERYRRGDVVRLKLALKIKGDLDPEVSFIVNEWEDSETEENDFSVMI